MSFNITVEGGKSVRLPTKGKYCDRDIVITAEGGAEPVIEPLVVAENGTYTAPDGVDGYSPVIVNVEAGGGGGEGWIGDGNTHLWIHLEEGRTAPMVGVCPKVTVTVDWGDGSEPDVLTGTSVSTVKWTPNHEYGEAGDYVISLTVDGEMGLAGYSSSSASAYILRHSSRSDDRNRAYHNSLQKIEIGNGVASIGNYAFSGCRSLSYIALPDSITSIGNYAFNNCYSLASVTIPDSVTSIGSSAFAYCYGLISIAIPGGVTSIGGSAFSYCYSLSSIAISDGLTSIGNSMFSSCHCLSSIAIPDSVTSIDNYAFSSCLGVKYYDFTTHTSVPTLSGTKAFTGIPADCEIRVPAALYDEWIAATNWATYAAKIVAV